MATLNAGQEKLFTWYDKIHEAHEVMPEEERQELAEWERPHLDGSMVATSNWPGWEKYIGKRPTPTS